MGRGPGWANPPTSDWKTSSSSTLSMLSTPLELVCHPTFIMTHYPIRPPAAQLRRSGISVVNPGVFRPLKGYSTLFRINRSSRSSMELAPTATRQVSASPLSAFRFAPTSSSKSLQGSSGLFRDVQCPVSAFPLSRFPLCPASALPTSTAPLTRSKGAQLRHPVTLGTVL